MTTDNTNLIEVRNLKKYFPIKGGVFQSTIGSVKAVDDRQNGPEPDQADER